ncbi:endonuclease/exonuclease/phosphatase family protein [Streptomyces sp. DSM 44917]|uniref:Endonuclease/exonuclease/phosphatase family protein n=1 Tax=Streptomyces boetiae TaxID=3075541 RepID=A0ABU2L4A7_9ACTN|nr:endonuclease/exonuclease/phosphatase family protein [Streptomyces sp. DSM 44917]MDT0306251.1 endonuclease/exonuclease/phosphatase family protein [Streptomyces sp. DSM 44917]
MDTPGIRRDEGGAGSGGARDGDDGAGGPAEPGDEGNATPPGDGAPRWRDRVGRWRRGWWIAGLSLALALVMLVHSRIPNEIGNLGSLLQTFLPWLGLAIPALALCGVLRRSATAVVAVLVPALVWVDLFGGLLVDKSGEGGALMVVSHNVDADNADPAETARRLAESEADVIALQELPQGEVATYEEALSASHPFHTVQGTVGLWSRYPLSGTAPVDIGMGWTRAMRSTVATDDGEVAVYVAHLPSVRVQFRAGFTAGQRDDAAERLARAIASETVPRTLLLGDLNGTMNDGALAPLTSQLRSTQGAAGEGFGFSWPAGFPMARIDQILVRGLEPVSSWTLPATGSDHLPVAARVDL